MLRSKLSIFCLLAWSLTQSQTLPPGTSRVKDILIDQTEIKNIHWLEYLKDLKYNVGKEAYKAALPDTTIWEQVYDGELAAAFVKSYLRDPGFHHFPVVGVTYDQASAYCHWRSKVVNKKNGSGMVAYRLPTPAEWVRVARESLSFQPVVNFDNLDKMKFPRANLTEIKRLSGSALSLNRLKRSMIEFYKRNPVLLFENLDTEEDYEFKAYLGVGHGPKRTLSSGSVNDLRGNVSEMTSERGVAMGGNWSTTLGRSRASVRFEYDSPSAVLGFRCACDLVTK